MVRRAGVDRGRRRRPRRTTGGHGPATTDHPSNAPGGSGVFALRWFTCAAADADEFVTLSASAWPEFEAANPGTRVFGLFRALGGGDAGPSGATGPTEADPDVARFLLC